MAIVVGALAVHLAQRQWATYFDGASLVRANADVFEVLQWRVSVQDRWYGVLTGEEWGLQPKVASVFGLPTINDYEPQTSQRFADLDVIMRADVPPQGREQLPLQVHPDAAEPPRLRSARDPVSGRRQGEREDSAGPRAVAARERGRQRQNIRDPQAFPRAYWVPTATVEPDPVRLLLEVAFGDRDLRQTVLLEAPPPAGSAGSAGGTGAVRIEEDRSEQVRIRVVADAPGFLVLTDQHYPGWSATVNGAPARVLRANHAFRGVPVPGGESTVRLTYRPAAFSLGAIVSLMALAGVFVLLVAKRDARRTLPA